MLSEDEEQLVRLFARERNNSDRLWFYAAALFAPVAIGIYGVVQRDWLALAVAFFGLFGMVAWSVHREFRYAIHFRGICTKVLNSDLVPRAKNE